MGITRTHLDFMEEAKKAFEENQMLETYRNGDDTLIALRYGMDRDCIKIHEFGYEIGFFSNIMGKAPQLHIGLKVREAVQWFAREMETQLKHNDHKGGWKNSTRSFLQQRLIKNLQKLSSCSSHLEYRRRCANIANFAMMLSENDLQEEVERL